MNISRNGRGDGYIELTNTGEVCGLCTTSIRYILPIYLRNYYAMLRLQILTVYWSYASAMRISINTIGIRLTTWRSLFKETSIEAITYTQTVHRQVLW